MWLFYWGEDECEIYEYMLKKEREGKPKKVVKIAGLRNP
jgi:hypothetical protein